MSYCHNCGAKASKDAKYCHECGKELLAEKISKKATSKENKTSTITQEYTCPNCDKDFTVEAISKEELEEGFSADCPHCGKECEIEPEEDEEEDSRGKKIEKVVEREYHHEQPKRGGGGLVAFIVIIIVLAIIFFVAIGSGALDNLTKGSGVSYVDPCERDFNQCNRGCGEGILNSLCKEKCTYQYNRCREG